jgi:hypothetical protein
MGQHIVRQRMFRERIILGCILVLMHLIMPAKILGDYAIYRTGIAGKLPKILIPERLIRMWWSTRLVGSLLFLPAVWIVCALALARCQVGSIAAVSLSAALVLILYFGLRQFDRVWSYVNSYSVGSAKKLAGDCAVFQVFLGPAWRRRDRERCLCAVRAACDWLKKKAAEQGVSLTLMTDPREIFLLDDVPMPLSALRWPDRWRAYRYEDDRVRRHMETLRPQLAAAVREHVRRLPAEPDQVCLIAHVPRTGIGFAMPATNDLHVESELELCVCGRASSAAVYAHELLHLFGAPDLYFNPWRVLTRRGETDEFAQLFERQLVSSGMEIFNAYFWNSIMCTTSMGLERLTIDPITARAVGWRKPDRQYLKTVEQAEQAFGEAMVDVLHKV